jgi:hypothetical protein
MTMYGIRNAPVKHRMSSTGKVSLTTKIGIQAPPVLRNFKLRSFRLKLF